MNKNVLGGLAAIIALAAIFYFSHRDAEPVAPAPVVHVAPAAPVVAAKPEKPVVGKPPLPLPAPEAITEKRPTPVEAKPTAKPEAPKPTVTFYRVEKGGARGASVECSTVHPFADGKSPAELAVLAKQYGVTESELKRYYVCTN